MKVIEQLLSQLPVLLLIMLYNEFKSLIQMKPLYS